MANNYLVPANVHFNIDGKQANIMEYDMNIVVKNGMEYDPTTALGRDNYALRKGKHFSVEHQNGGHEISVSILDTPDKQFAEPIKLLEKMQEATKANDPKKYLKDINFTFGHDDKNSFLNLKFKGYVNGSVKHEHDETGIPKITFRIVISDPTTFDIKPA